MKFHYRYLEDCHTATGTVIVIDVLRAFSTAAYAFSMGAREILLVGTVEEALSLRQQVQNSKVMGEVNGIRPDGFDFGNSPTYLSQEDLSGVTMIQRTTAGTQGAVRSRNAEVLLASSLVVADATVKRVKKLGSDQITFVITGKDFGGGDEDLACAEYLEALLKRNGPTPSLSSSVYLPPGMHPSTSIPPGSASPSPTWITVPKSTNSISPCPLSVIMEDSSCVV